MDQSTSEVRMANWLTIAKQCQNRPNGQSARQWLAENGVPEKQYYYWLRKIRSQSYQELKNQLPAVASDQLPENRFAEIPDPDIPSEGSSPAVVIKTSQAQIEIASSVSDSLMLRLVKAAIHAL